MPKYLYRISLIHVEQTNAKSRTKNLGAIAQMETDQRRDATAEVRRLQEMTARPSWQIPTQIIAERSEITDFVAVDIDTLEPYSHNAEDAKEFPDLAAKSMES